MASAAASEVDAGGLAAAVRAHAAGVPLHSRLEGTLRSLIHGGQIATGAVLPGELELTAKLGISRHTVRRASCAAIAISIRSTCRGAADELLEPTAARGPYSDVRFLPLAALLLSASLVSPAFAETDEPAVAGPMLQPLNGTPAACDPSRPGFRYLEVRGSGFDAWSSQHLVGTLVDGGGAAQAHWPTIWVTPQGQLTLELNLCAAPLQNRPALVPGDYTISVGETDGSPIAATGITVRDPLAEVDDAAPAPTGAEPTQTPTPRSGPGSLQQPLPAGTAANLVDGWQLGVTRVDPDAYNAIKSAIPSAVAPGADMRDIMLALQATYTGIGTGTFTAVRLNLLNPRTQARYDQVANNCGAVPGAISPNVVTPGTVVLGSVCFSVPAADVGSLLLVDNQPSDADRVYLALP